MSTLNRPDYFPRLLESALEERLQSFPAVAVLGPRQCGKTTLVRQMLERTSRAIYLDLERPSDLRKLDDPELYFRTQRTLQEHPLFCLDEIQRLPEIFPVLRSLIDEDGRNGQFLLLGSASRDLIRQTSETLAGRIIFVELTPFLAPEVGVADLAALTRYWLRGGFPRSFLAISDEASSVWRESFARTYLERDLPQLGFRIPAESLLRLWTMLAHNHGQTLNKARLGGALGVSHTTVGSYLDLLTQTFMVRQLQPYSSNTKKRWVKSPKVYLRDAGMLHSLLEIQDHDDLLGHPVRGASWEGLVIENAIATLPNWRPSFYRTHHGNEVDLVLSRGQKTLVIECKAATAPRVGRGFWNVLGDLTPARTWVVAPVEDRYPLRENVWVTSLGNLLEDLKEFR